MDNSVKNDNGDYYGFAFLREDLFLGTYAGPAIRKDVLDKVGKEVPTTMDEWTDVLTAMKDVVKYPFSSRSGISDLFTPLRALSRPPITTTWKTARSISAMPRLA